MFDADSEYDGFKAPFQICFNLIYVFVLFFSDGNFCDDSMSLSLLYDNV